MASANAARTLRRSRNYCSASNHALTAAVSSPTAPAWMSAMFCSPNEMMPRCSSMTHSWPPTCGSTGPMASSKKSALLAALVLGGGGRFLSYGGAAPQLVLEIGNLAHPALLTTLGVPGALCKSSRTADNCCSLARSLVLSSRTSGPEDISAVSLCATCLTISPCPMTSLPWTSTSKGRKSPLRHLAVVRPSRRCFRPSPARCTRLVSITMFSGRTDYKLDANDAASLTLNEGLPIRLAGDGGLRARCKFAGLRAQRGSHNLSRDLDRHLICCGRVHINTTTMHAR